MKFLPLILLLLFTGCRLLPVPEKSATKAQSAQSLEAVKPLVVSAPVETVRFAQTDRHNFTIIYPANIDSSQYDWTVISSTNLSDWRTEPLERDGSNIIVHINGRNPIFFRLKGGLAAKP